MISHIEVEEIEDYSFQKQEDKRPITSKWKGVPFIRNHSLIAAIKEMLQLLENRDVCKIGIVGDQSTGKTTLEDVIAHLMHKYSSIPFAVRRFGKKEFLNMRETLEKLEPANYILKFSDLSYLSADATKKQIDTVKQVITTIRHLREDVKIVLIYDYHYTLALDKYLRQADFRFFTSIGSSEADNIMNIVKDKYKGRIGQFKKLTVEQANKGKASFQLKINAPPFVYSYKKPFVVCLFWNEYRLRYVIFPTRQWIDKICHVCTLGDGLPSEVPVDQFIKETNDKFGDRIVETAIKIIAMENGIHTFSSPVESAIKYIHRALSMKQIPLETLLTEYGLDNTFTRLRKKPDGILLQEAKKEDVVLNGK